MGHDFRAVLPDQLAVISVIRNPATGAWFFLLAATGLSGWLAESHRGVSLAGLLIALVAAVKIDVIMQHFMELKDGPPVWRMIMRAWIIVVTCIAASGFLSL